MKMADIFPEHIREWIAWMQAEGRSAWTIQYCKSSILSSIFTTALNDQVTYIHPCRGVKIPSVPATPRTIVTPEEFDMLYAALPDADAQLLVETAIETGLRWGELAELRVGDMDLVTRVLTVSRKVIELNRRFHPDGKRFLVINYPKDKEYRQLKISMQIATKLAAHIKRVNLESGALLFARRAAAPVSLRVIPEPDALGLTEPNEAGRRYRHGTLSAYNAGRCRCAHCRGAFADYRARRRAANGPPIGSRAPLPFLTVPTATEDAQVPTAPVLVSVRVIVLAVAFAVADQPGATVHVVAASAWAGTPPRPTARAAAPARNPAIKRICMGLLLLLTYVPDESRTSSTRRSSTACSQPASATRVRFSSNWTSEISDTSTLAPKASRNPKSEPANMPVARGP